MADDITTETPVPEKTPVEILTCAADYIETHGLAKYQLENAVGQCCTLGAIAKCATGSASDPLWRQSGTPAYSAKQAVLAYTRSESVAEWNDAFNRTTADVVATLRAVAAQLGGK